MRDADFNFGSERFDLVLFSWTMPPANLMTRIADSLRPGGLVVLDAAPTGSPETPF